MLDVILFLRAINMMGWRTVSLHRLEVRPSLPDDPDDGTDLSCATLIRGIGGQVVLAAALNTFSFPLLCAVPRGVLGESTLLEWQMSQCWGFSERIINYQYKYQNKPCFCVPHSSHYSWIKNKKKEYALFSRSLGNSILSPGCSFWHEEIILLASQSVSGVRVLWITGFGAFPTSWWEICSFTPPLRSGRLAGGQLNCMPSPNQCDQGSECT